MGDYYDFEIQVIDGKESPVFCYQNKNTNYQEVVVELSSAQYELARAWHKKHDELTKEKDLLIKGFLGL